LRDGGGARGDRHRADDQCNNSADPHHRSPWPLAL
jgi:hypothetical protein